MKKIIIAYHAYLHGPHYMEMITEQLRKIMNAKLLPDGTYDANIFKRCSKMYVGVIDTPDKKPEWGVEWITKFLNCSSSKDKGGKVKSKVEIVVYPDNKEEANTMKWIRDYSKDNPGDYVLYFHTKGISRYSAGTESWRRYMEYFVLENWKACVAKLKEGYDCCGVMWNSDTPLGFHPHFSGTFWWANTSYINTLDHKFLDSKNRFDREFWIGTNPNVKAFEFHNSGLNNKRSLLMHNGHYNTEYPRCNYEKKKEMKLHIIVTVYNRLIPLKRLIYDLLLQTNQNWTLYVVQDGKALKGVARFISSFKDPRMTFIGTDQANGHYGFPNRNMMLQKIQGETYDYVLFTNDDNQYLPVFVDTMLKNCGSDVGFVFCNTIHNYFNYEILHTQIRVGYIDMGSFVVRLDVAKIIGFSRVCETADGTYAEECALECRRRGLEILAINKALYIHN
jgi:hypothetical protein